MGGLGLYNPCGQKCARGFPLVSEFTFFLSEPISGCITLHGYARTVGGFIREFILYGGGGGEEHILEPLILRGDPLGLPMRPGKGTYSRASDVSPTRGVSMYTVVKLGIGLLIPARLRLVNLPA